jgi:hypothetical protein
MKMLTTIIAALALMTAIAAPAFAQSSSTDGYSDSAGQVQAQVGNGSGGGTPPAGGSSAAATPVSTTDGGSTLPFTGLDVALLLGAGGLLVAAGLGMRRLTRAPDAA